MPRPLLCCPYPEQGCLARLAEAGPAPMKPAGGGQPKPRRRGEPRLGQDSPGCKCLVCSEAVWTRLTPPRPGSTSRGPGDTRRKPQPPFPGCPDSCRPTFHLFSKTEAKTHQSSGACCQRGQSQVGRGTGNSRGCWCRSQRGRGWVPPSTRRCLKGQGHELGGGQPQLWGVGVADRAGAPPGGSGTDRRPAGALPTQYESEH